MTCKLACALLGLLDPSSLPNSPFLFPFIFTSLSLLFLPLTFTPCIATMPLPVDLTSEEKSRQFKGRAILRLGHVISDTLPSSTPVLSSVKGFAQTILSECDVRLTFLHNNSPKVILVAGDCQSLRRC